MKNNHGRKYLKEAIFGRLLLVLCLALVWAAAIFARLIYLQGFKSEDYIRQAEGQQQGFIELSPKRGAILDRNLEELAINVRSHSVYTHPDQIGDPLEASQKLANVLGIPADEVYEQLTSEAAFTYLKRRITPLEAKQVGDLELDGIHLTEESRRFYPNMELASHLLGFVNIDNTGLGGLEYAYREDLRGQKRMVQLKVDARRNSYLRSSSDEKIEGNILVLTIDRAIQHVVETALRKAVELHGAIDGSAIVMDPMTGQILAMACYPNFNPNDPGKYPLDHRRNRSILDLYEPGSTFKIITLSALLEEGLSSPNEVINCRAGTARIGRKVYHEAKRSFEDLTLTQVIAKSSNVGTVKLALRLGEEKLHHYVESFGFGQKTGIDLPGEENGLLRPVSQWSKISIGAISIGQEIGVTPLQMVRAASAIANGGHLVTPHVVRRVLSPAGDLLLSRKPERKRILSESTTRQARQIMTSVVLEGTGRLSKLKGFSSAGKTGTAQKIVDGKYSKSKYVGSFIGFAPVDDPALVCLVVINEPKGLPWGGRVAGPAFKEIMELSLIHQGVTPDLPVEMVNPQIRMARSKKPPTQVRHAESAPSESASQSEEGLLAEHFSETVLTVLKSEPEKRAGNQSLTVNLSSEPLPDFKGRTLRQVARDCARLSVKLKVSGTGMAVGQRPAPGRPISQGMVCEVFFSNERQSGNETNRVVLLRTGEHAGTDHSQR
jgi:cell division protein FtsI/penicillin-binding protein 2